MEKVEVSPIDPGAFDMLAMCLEAVEEQAQGDPGPAMQRARAWLEENVERFPEGAVSVWSGRRG